MPGGETGEVSTTDSELVLVSKSARGTELGPVSKASVSLEAAGPDVAAGACTGSGSALALELPGSEAAHAGESSSRRLLIIDQNCGGVQKLGIGTRGQDGCVPGSWAPG